MVSQYIQWKVSDITKEGDYAIMSDPATGTMFLGPDQGEGITGLKDANGERIAFTYVNLLMPGVVASEFEVTAIGIPFGAWLTCETTTMSGTLLDSDDVQQTDPSSILPVVARCIFGQIPLDWPPG